MNARGLDVSKYEPNPVNIDWGAYDFGIVRAFDGVTADPLFKQHRDYVRASGIPWWCYSFYDFRYDAKRQAQRTVELIQEDPGCLPVAFELEEWGKPPFKVEFPPRVRLLTGLGNLINEYYRLTNKKPFIYLNPDAINHLSPVPDWLLNCPLWIAHWYAVNPKYTPWVEWTLWQWRGEPDHSWFNGTKEELAAYIQFHGNPPPEPKDWQHSVDAFLRTVGYTGPEPE